MEVQKNIEVTLTPKEVEQIVKTHLQNTHGYAITNVNFKVGPRHDTDDLGGYPSYTMTEILCTGKL